MKTLAALVMLLASATIFAEDYSVGISSAGLNLYEITKRGASLVGAPFPTPALDANPLTPVIAMMNTRHDFVFAVYEHLNSSDGTAYILGLKVTESGLQKQWVFNQVLNMNPEANPLVKVTTGKNYATVIWTNDFTSPYTGWIINERGQLVAGLLSQLGGNETISIHIPPEENFYYFCHYVGFPNTQIDTVSVYQLERFWLNVGVPGPPPARKLLFTSTDPVFISSVCN
jgi:hypothetical protein